MDKEGECRRWPPDSKKMFFDHSHLEPWRRERGTSPYYWTEMSEAKGGAGHSSSKFPQDTRSSRPIGASSAPEALVGPGSAGGGSGAKASAGIVSPPNKFAGGPKKSSSNKFFRKHRRSSSTSSSEDLTQDLSCQQGPQNPQGTESPQVDVPPSLARGNTDDHQQPYHPKRFPSFKYVRRPNLN